MRRIVTGLLCLIFLLVTEKPTMAVSDYYRNLLKSNYTTRIPGRVKSARAFYDKYGPWLQKYSGGMPVGFMAAIAQWESDGKMSSSGDPILGEVGFYQISNSAIARYRIPASLRATPEGNIFIAGVEYNEYAAGLKADFPHLFVSGSQDHWMMARLAFAIGYYGTSTIIKRAKPSHGQVWRGVVAWADRTGAMAFGSSQSASKVWFRIKNIDIQWKVGQQIEQGWYGKPQWVPPLVNYVVWKKARPYLTSALSPVIVTAMLSYAALFLF